ncbi:MAG: DRTGG domain-containing protein [Clostridiales bacterium]|nr:DRTGG domain-containing protein [Eubacteriales bacterium]MDH7565428.1 DRTGG domain-containing protein [Clostridiales bacterium]
MKVKEFAEKLELKRLTGESGLDKEITGVYACDLLSWVMSHAVKGNIWITVITNINIVAVAVLTEVSCIIVPEGLKVENVTIKKAQQQGIAILSSSMDTYGICCRAYTLLGK